jgi:hypothetical protein
VERTSVEDIRLVAQSILDALGRRAPPWRILSVAQVQVPAGPSTEGVTLALFSWHTGRPPGTWKSSDEPLVAVTLGAAGSEEPPVTAYYSPWVPHLDAIVELASQIQDHAIEESWGAPLPPCPGHTHPLSPHVSNGDAVWECPRDPEHHRVLIDPDAHRQPGGEAR